MHPLCEITGHVLYLAAELKIVYIFAVGQPLEIFVALLLRRKHGSSGATAMGVPTRPNKVLGVDALQIVANIGLRVVVVRNGNADADNKGNLLPSLTIGPPVCHIVFRGGQSQSIFVSTTVNAPPGVIGLGGLGEAEHAVFVTHTAE